MTTFPVVVEVMQVV